MKKPAPSTTAADSRWNSLYTTGAYAAFAMLAVMAAQIVIFIIWPPPDSVEGFFALFQHNWLLGLLSMDLLYIVNNALIILIYLALWAALRRQHEPALIIGLVFGFIGLAGYYASNTCFEMLSLSRQYAAAATEAQRTALLGGGYALLAIYKGTAFDVYYVLNAITLLIFAAVMLRSDVFSRRTAAWGLAAGVLMAIPSTAGTIGLVFSLASLAPWAVFAVMAARRLLKLAA